MLFSSWFQVFDQFLFCLTFLACRWAPSAAEMVGIHQNRITGYIWLIQHPCRAFPRHRTHLWALRNENSNIKKCFFQAQMMISSIWWILILFRLFWLAGERLVPRKWSAYIKIESLDTYDSFNIHAEHFRGTARICERQKWKFEFKKMFFSSSNHDFKHLIHFYFVLTFLACRLAPGAAAMDWLLLLNVGRFRDFSLLLKMASFEFME